MRANDHYCLSCYRTRAFGHFRVIHFSAEPGSCVLVLEAATCKFILTVLAVVVIPVKAEDPEHGAYHTHTTLNTALGLQLTGNDTWKCVRTSVITGSDMSSV